MGFLGEDERLYGVEWIQELVDKEILPVVEQDEITGREDRGG